MTLRSIYTPTHDTLIAKSEGSQIKMMWELLGWGIFVGVGALFWGQFSYFPHLR